MKKFGKGCLILIGVVVVLGIIGAVVGNKGSQSSSTVSPTGTQTAQGTIAPKPTPIVVDAATLVGEYDKNKLAAQDKYTGKMVQTTGYIKNISNDITGKYYLSLNPNNDKYYFGTTIACYFNEKGDLTTLSNGQAVTVVGTMHDMSIGIVDMQDCQLVK